MRKLRTLFAGLIAVTVILVFKIASPDLLDPLSDALSDRFQRVAPRPYEDAPVRVIDIDEASLDEFGQWPWPRSRIADLTARLNGLGAAAIAFDIVFAEPDQTSPARVLEPLRRELGLGTDLVLPDNDRVFAEALNTSRSVLGFALGAEPTPRSPQAKAGIATLGDDPTRTLRVFSGATVNLSILEEAATGNGNFSIAAEDARTVRALPMVARLGDTLVPSLTAEALRVAQGASSLILRETDGGTATLETMAPLTLRVGALEIPLSADGSYPLRFTGPAPERSISAKRLFDPNDKGLAGEVAGRIVLIGSSAVGLSDLRPTPLNPFEPGVAIHAAALEQILLDQPLQRPALAPVGEFAGAAVLGFGTVILVAFTPVWLGTAASLALFAGLVVGAFLAFDQVGIVLDPSLALLTVAAGFAVTIIVRVGLSERDKARLRTAFAHYLSPEMVKSLAANPNALKLGGETREMTFLFTDLEGFTAFTESCDPPTLVRVLNAYLSEMCAIVTRHGGTIDKIVGDALHAMFNAPLDQPDHASRAVACALELAAFSKRFTAERAEEGLTIGKTRIGVNTGQAVVGNFGGAGRFDYTAHGDAINTAARLEAANKEIGTTICVSASTVAQVHGVRFRPVGTLALKGKALGVAAFEPVDGVEATSGETTFDVGKGVNEVVVAQAAVA